MAKKSGAVEPNEPARVVGSRSYTLIALLLVAGSAELHAQSPPTPRPADAQSVAVVGRYRLQSNPWVNLHQRLLYEARFETPALALSGDDLSRWKKAVESYRAFLGKRSPIFDEELIAVNDALSAANGFDLPGSIPRAASETLRAAMPLYRAVQWEDDDRVNRFWIAVAEPMLASAAEELASAHAKAYAMPFPTHILVDVSAVGWEFGAYTVGEGESAHVVMTSREPGYQGFRALEMLMHEPSHAIVAPASGAIGADLARASRELDIKPYANLWHAILFYTSGELTRRALASRGVADYRPVVHDVYGGPYRGFQKPLETHLAGVSRRQGLARRGDPADPDRDRAAAEEVTATRRVRRDVP